MNDVFKEQIVKRKKSGKDTAKKFGLIAALFIIFFVTLVLVQAFAFIITVVAGFGAFWLMGMLNIEYEYVFTNGELDIDIIYNQNKRKRLYTGTVKDFDVMAHVDDKNHVRDFDGANETKDYSSGVTTNDTYAFLTSYKGKRLKIIFEPNEMMIKAIASVLTPRKLFKKI